MNDGVDELPPLDEAIAVAVDAGDRPKLLRALARDVVCVKQPGDGPPPGTPEIRSYEPGARPLPIVEDDEGNRAVPVFTSSARLEQFYGGGQELVWAQVPAGVLASEWPAGAAMLVDAGSPHAVVVERAEVETIALLFADANVAEAFAAGPATAVRMAAPDREPTELLDPLLRIAERHGGVVALRYGVCVLDEPEARPWLVVGVQPAEGAAVRPLLEEAVKALRDATDAFVDLRSLDPQSVADGAVERWLLQEAPAATPGTAL